MSSVFASHRRTDGRRAFAELTETTNRSMIGLESGSMSQKFIEKPIAYPTLVHNTTALRPSESPDPTPVLDNIEFNTCISSFLYHIGLTKYITAFLRNSIMTCGQLILTPSSVLKDIVPCEMDCKSILYPLRDLYIACISGGITAPAVQTTVSVSPRSLRSLESNPSLASLSGSMCSSLSPALASTVSEGSFSEAAAPLCRPSERPLHNTHRIVSKRQNDPYAFQCITAEDAHDYMAPRSSARGISASVGLKQDMNSKLQQPDDRVTTVIRGPPPPAVSVNASIAKPQENATVVCRCLVRFKHRQSEFSSTFRVLPGQYVMVSGDRGLDLGLVLRVNTDQDETYPERTGPQGAIMRLAFQKEVDYVNRTLRVEEDAAREVCRARAQRLNLNLRVSHAEYQYDKRKLTFYYEANERVDFVMLLKDLYREFGCRIWMERMVADTISPINTAAAATTSVNVDGATA